MEVTRKLEWDMGHRVPNHKSKCRNVHGHRYVAEITMEGDVVGDKGISDEGMVIDFGDIKTIAGNFIDEQLDHGYMGNFNLDREILLMLSDMKLKTMAVHFIPTAENIAAWLFEKLSPLFEQTYQNSLRLKRIRLWETPNSYVDYEEKVLPGINISLTKVAFENNNLTPAISTLQQETPMVKSEVPNIMATKNPTK